MSLVCSTPRIETTCSWANSGISVSSAGETSFSEDGNIMSWSGPLEYYSADQDRDMDKFPHEGQEPIFVFPGASQATRL